MLQDGEGEWVRKQALKLMKASCIEGMLERYIYGEGTGLWHLCAALSRRNITKEVKTVNAFEYNRH